MPMSTPEHLAGRYADRVDHFPKVLESLIAPALERAGLQIRRPDRAGTENIQAGIINDLQDANLVLADLSGLNPNVFLELGIRSALDRPVCLVWDGHDRLPFDSGTLNTHRYEPQPVYELNHEISKMAKFIEDTVANAADGRNALWKYFGSARKLTAAELQPEDASLHARLDRIADLLETSRALPETLRERSGPGISEALALIDEVAERVRSVLVDAGAAGAHGSRIGVICREILGDDYSAFIGAGNLNQALNRLGLRIRTNASGMFFVDA